MKQYTVAVVGATGLVGSEMIKVLIQRNFPVKELQLFATSNSAGRTVNVAGTDIVVRDIGKSDLLGIDFALFAGGEIASADYARKVALNGGVVIDNSAEFRMDPEVPLVVPEVNPEHLRNHGGIIANPNCSTIQMVVVLKPIHDKAGLKRVIVSTYQSVSGTGRAAVDELKEQARLILEGKEDEIDPQVYPHRIAFNLLPHIGSFKENGYTGEELKMIYETRKIMGDDSLALSATTVRVPTFVGHCESINLETKTKISPEEVRTLLENSPGIKLMDNPTENLYPFTVMAADTDDVFVGRIRKDMSCENGIELFIAADNLRKGAALNAVQIAEKMIEMKLL